MKSVNHALAFAWFIIHQPTRVLQAGQRKATANHVSAITPEPAHARSNITAEGTESMDAHATRSTSSIIDAKIHSFHRWPVTANQDLRPVIV